MAANYVFEQQDTPNWKKAIVITDDYQSVKHYQSKCKVIWIGGNKTNSNVISFDARLSNRILADAIIEIMERKDKEQIICVGERGKELALKMTDLQKIRSTMEDTNLFVYHRNFDMNKGLISQTPGVVDLFNKHAGKTGVVVAAGPSLDYTIPWIKEHRDDLVVFAGGSSNISLNEHGIIPDYLVMLDPFSMEEHKITDKSRWYGEIHPDTMVLAAYSAHPDSFRGHKKLRFWLTNFEMKTLEAAGYPQTGVFNVNISVSVNVLYFADFCGCKQIIICGQDCGKQEGGKDHSWGNDGYFERNGAHRLIKGWSGKKDIVTDLTYEELKDWLEYTIPLLNCKNVYNTSKYGAYIDSCKNISIEEVPI